MIRKKRMGKGIAKDFKNLYPDMFTSYQKYCESGDFSVGKLQLYKTKNHWILNFPTKKDWRNPSKIEYISIWDTYNDPFIKKIRTELKAQGFKKKFKVIFSSELPLCLEKGSFEGVTGSFGLMMASVTIQKLVNKLQK